MSGTQHNLSSVLVTVAVRHCYLGEITTSDNNMCTLTTPPSLPFPPPSTAVSGTQHNLSSVLVTVAVRHCYLGEITTANNDLCTPCLADTYSFNPANTSCDTCDTTVSTCDFNKSTTDVVPIGSILVPEDGYWHSNAFSPQVGGCTCAFDLLQHFLC